jgi:hypothetical protein
MLLDEGKWFRTDTAGATSISSPGLRRWRSLLGLQDFQGITADSRALYYSDGLAGTEWKLGGPNRTVVDSGRTPRPKAPPCQGEGRGFGSRLPLSRAGRCGPVSAPRMSVDVSPVNPRAHRWSLPELEAHVVRQDSRFRVVAHAIRTAAPRCSRSKGPD